MPRKIVSFDIGKTDMKATVVETGFRDFKVGSFHQEALSADPEAMARGIGRFVEEHAADADTMVSALPAESVSWRTLRLPFRDNRKIAQTVPFELESNVPFGLDDVVVDYQVLDRDDAGTTVLAALAPKDEVERHLELLQAAGVDPKIVDAGPLALLNALNLVTDRPRSFAFVHCGERAVTVALFRGGKLEGVRTLTDTEAFGVAGNGAANGAATSPGPALVGSVRWTLLALNGGPLEERFPCYLACSAEWVESLARELEERVDVDVRRLDRVAFDKVDPAAKASAPAFVSSLGLALREATPADSVGVNFRRGEFTYHRSEQELRAGLRTAAMLALLVVALTVGELYAKYRESQVRLGAVEDQIHQVFEATLPEAGRVGRPLAVLEEQIEYLRQDVKMLDDVVPVANSTSVDLLRAVSAAVPTSVRIDSGEYLMDPDSVRLTGNTDTFESVDSLKQKFLDTGFFSDVQVKDATTKKDGVDFRMIMMLNKDFRPPAGSR